MMINLTKIHQAILVVLALSIMAVGCDDPYKTIDYRKLQAEENALLQEYLDLELENLKAGATLYKFNENNGLHYFEIEKGSGDTILPGNIVGFRYVYYGLERDDNGDPKLYLWDQNIQALESSVYQVGVPQNNASVGIDEGIKYMNHLGKSKMILPSTIGPFQGRFFTIIADIEVTYLVNE